MTLVTVLTVVNVVTEVTVVAVVTITTKKTHNMQSLCISTKNMVDHVVTSKSLKVCVLASVVDLTEEESATKMATPISFFCFNCTD